jgi:hypothetical protein
MDSSARPAPVDLETVNENWATTVSEIINETDSKCDPWICQCQQAHVDSEIVNENWFAVDSEIIT